MHIIICVILLFTCAAVSLGAEHEIIVYDGVEYKISPDELQFAQEDLKLRADDKKECIRSLKFRAAQVVFEELLECVDDDQRPKLLTDRSYNRGAFNPQILVIADGRYAYISKTRDYGKAETRNDIVVLTSEYNNSVQEYRVAFAGEILYLIEADRVREFQTKLKQNKQQFGYYFGSRVDDPKRMVNFTLP